MSNADNIKELQHLLQQTVLELLEMSKRIDQIEMVLTPPPPPAPDWRKERTLRLAEPEPPLIDGLRDRIQQAAVDRRDIPGIPGRRFRCLT